MKKMLMSLLVIISFTVSLQLAAKTQHNSSMPKQFDIVGTWQGVLKISSVELRIVFNVARDTIGNLTATLDSPDQGAYDIPVDEIIFNMDSVKFIVNSVAGFYEGKIIEDSVMFDGNWNQGGMVLPLVLRKTDKVEKPNRPQEPKEPFPYKVEEVKFENKTAKITLSGTLTFPNEGGLFPAVVLITGSGPQNRDEELLGHKPFLVLADYLTRNGIAVLRFDDRGTGESSGDFSTATSVDFSDDVLAAVEFLKSREEINLDQIGLIGHSEGGIIAPMAANSSKDIAFIVLMAGTGLRGDSILILQTGLIMRANGEGEEVIKRDLRIQRGVYNIVLSNSDSTEADKKLRQHYEDVYAELSGEEKNEIGDIEKFLENQSKVLLNPWFRYFIKYDPYSALTKVKCPVLAICGEKDLQVPPKENLAAIEMALKEGGNKNYRIAELKGLNHLFQTAETGSPLEYGKIEETFSPDAMKLILDWILGLERK
jgi:fermentation-respiration switch protein FrsA (DUF1100 family)